jgi:hypothetical protein
MLMLLMSLLVSSIEQIIDLTGIPANGAALHARPSHTFPSEAQHCLGTKPDANPRMRSKRNVAI